MTRVIVVGAGGHGCVVVDILHAMQAAGSVMETIGVVDDNDTLHGSTVLGIPVLGGTEQLANVAHDAIVVAIGHNGHRERLTEILQRRGERFAVARHPSSVVGLGAVVEEGVMICAGAIVGPESRIGRGVILNTACSVDHHNDIGAYSHVGPGAHCGGSVSLSEGVLVGIGATILPGRRVGRATTIGAGAVVTRDVEAGLVVVGAPARVARMKL